MNQNKLTAPQVVADERAAFEAHSPTIYVGRYDNGSYENQHVDAMWKGWQARAALAAAPVQAQEPVYQVSQPFPADPAGTWRDASSDAYDLSHPERRRIIYLAPLQPVAVPDGAAYAIAAYEDIANISLKWMADNHPDTKLLDFLTSRASINFDDENCLLRFEVPSAFEGANNLREIIAAAKGEADRDDAEANGEADG